VAFRACDCGGFCSCIYVGLGTRYVLSLVSVEVSSLCKRFVATWVSTHVGSFARMQSSVDFQCARSQEERPTNVAPVWTKRGKRKYRSLLCLRWWSLRCPWVMKLLVQPSCVQMKGRSPVWMRMWVFRFPLSLKAFPQP
jgi:hypothetical protein